MADLDDAADTAEQETRELATRAESLEAADEARGEWFAHTAITRDHALRARAELRMRGIDPEDPNDWVTAQEWFDAHLTEQSEADLHREIRDEHDLTDTSLDTTSR